MRNRYLIDMEDYEKRYHTICEVCDVEVVVAVKEEDEVPLHCIMCGEQTLFEEVEN